MSLLFGIGTTEEAKTTAPTGSSSGLLFGISKPTTPTATPVSAPSTPSVAAPKSPFPSVDTLLAQKSSLSQADPNNIPSTDIRARFVAPLEDIPWYMRPGRVANDTIVNSSKDLYNRFSELSDSFQPNGSLETGTLTSKELAADRIAKVSSVGLGLVNTAFLPFTTLFKGGEQIPGVGEVFKHVNEFIGGVGELGGHIGDFINDKLPVSDKTKNNLKPVLHETFGLLSQFALGGLTHSVLKAKLEPLALEIRDAVSKDPVVKLKVNSIADETPVTMKTPEMIHSEALQVDLPKYMESVRNGQMSLQDAFNTLKERYPLNAEEINNRFAEFSKSQGYEAYTPPEDLPTIDMGKVPKSELPVIQTEAPSSLPPSKVYTYEPINDVVKASQISEAAIRRTVPSEAVATASARPELGKVNLKPIEGTGTSKVRGLAADIEAAAIEKKLTTGFGDLPEYQTMNIKQQAQLASDLLKSDYEKAKRVALGQEPSPEGLHPEAVFTAVEARAIKEGDVGTLKSLATKSSLTGEATTMGQRIKLLDERNPDSPVKAIRDVARAREEAAKKGNKNLKSVVKDTAKEIKAEIKKAAPKKQTWTEFIREIQCK